MKVNSCAFTISPKMQDFDNLIPGLKKILDRCGEWCLVVEVSDTGHRHMHGGVLCERSVSAVGEALRNYWKKVDEDYCKKTILCKTWYKPLKEKDIMDCMYEDYHSGIGSKTWMKYLFKTKVPVYYSDNFPKDEDELNELLAANVPQEARRANQCWTQLIRLNKLVVDHGLDEPETLADCARALNTLSWHFKVFQCPIDGRKFKQLVVAWWKYRVSYTGLAEEGPPVEDEADHIKKKRKREEEEE